MPDGTGPRIVSCPEYLVPPGFQLRDGGATGSVDCTPWAASRVIGASTCGGRLPSGRSIRLASDEPIPDRGSPGLNIPQVAEVAREHFGLFIDQRVGWRALDWDDYEARRRAGEPMILQASYQPIAESRFDAGRGFRGGHAFAETQHATIDSLADGRADGVWKFDGRLYPRDLMRKAAGQLVIGAAEGNLIRVGAGRAWCGVGRDRTPEYVVAIRPRAGKRVRRYRYFTIVAGRIAKVEVGETRGFGASCSIPRAFKWAEASAGSDDYRFLVRVTSGVHQGRWVKARWAEPEAVARADARAALAAALDDLDLDDPDDDAVPDVRTDPVEA